MDGTRVRHWVIADASICRGCDLCMLACSLHHTGQCSPEMARLRAVRAVGRYEFDISICRHCEDPACYAACPTEGAMARDEDGRVYIVEEECISCGSCMEACPYDGIYRHVALDAYLKCDLCGDRSGGPICVQVCPTGALALAADVGLLWFLRPGSGCAGCLFGLRRRIETVKLFMLELEFAFDRLSGSGRDLSAAFGGEL